MRPPVLSGEPIVSKPADAVDVMLRSGLRNLSLGPYLIEKCIYAGR
jgi:predicted NodU family carbamoyl transferase